MARDRGARGGGLGFFALCIRAFGCFDGCCPNIHPPPIESQYTRAPIHPETVGSPPRREDYETHEEYVRALHEWTNREISLFNLDEFS